jgi:hypothetical protein
MLPGIDRAKHRGQVSSRFGPRCCIMTRRGITYVNLRPMLYELKPQELEIRGLWSARVKHIAKMRRTPRHPLAKRVPVKPR